MRPRACEPQGPHERAARKPGSQDPSKRERAGQTARQGRARTWGEAAARQHRFAVTTPVVATERCTRSGPLHGVCERDAGGVFSPHSNASTARCKRQSASKKTPSRDLESDRLQTPQGASNRKPPGPPETSSRAGDRNRTRRDLSLRESRRRGRNVYDRNRPRSPRGARDRKRKQTSGRRGE